MAGGGCLALASLQQPASRPARPGYLDRTSSPVAPIELKSGHLTFMPKETWMIAACLTIALLIGLLAFSSYDKKTRLERARAELVDAQEAATKSRSEAAQLSDKLAASEQHAQ